MRKEVIIAIVLGSIIGISGAYFSLGPTRQTKTEIATEIETPAPTQAQDTSFKITTPLDTDVAKDKELTVVGITNPSSMVVVDTPQTTLLTSQEGNSFTTKVTLSEGINQVSFIEIGSEIKTITRDILMVPNTTDLKVRSGGITDITENGIQIRLETGEVTTIRTSPTTKYKNAAKTLKDITESEVAIGDFVYLAGRVQDKTYFADHVYVTTAVTKRAAPIEGSVAKTTARELTITTSEGDKAYTIANYTLYSLTQNALTKIKTPVTGRKVIILPASILVLES